MRLEESFSRLITAVSSITGVQAVGKSGGPDLPESGESDIDLFVYCSEIPELAERNQVVESIGLMNANVQQGGHWGVVDLVLLNGVEAYLMYFTLEETIDNVRDILDGKFPDKLDNYFYPTGKLATLRQITILYDDAGFLYSMKHRLEAYPGRLSSILAEYHSVQLGDTEDMARAVSRRDVLFYHFALDLALDHFLQALFAINKVYFSSRKRTLEYLDRFDVTPDRCAERLLEVVRLGGTPDTLTASYEMWQELTAELAALSEHNH